MIDNKFTEKTLNFFKTLDIDLVKKFIVFDEVSSTNIKAKELAIYGEYEGTVVIARIQKKGKGRFDRIWESPDGGLYLSIILKPDVFPDKITILPLLAALAVSKTINSYGLSAKIKWPNDVRVKGKKIAGILFESESYGPRYIVLGIGINLNIKINFLSREIRSISTSMSQEIGTDVNYHSFLKKLLLNLDKYYKLLLDKKYDFILKEWKKHSDTIGNRIKITTTTEKIVGKAYDIDMSGFLIVITDSGEYKKITSGDCVYLED